MTGAGDPARTLREDDALVEALRRHWRYTGEDEDQAHDIYHSDAILEFPQSGERFDGVTNFLAWRRRYPAALKFRIRRISRRDNLVVAENLISYDESPWQLTVNLFEFRADKVARERIYIMDGWEAPEWRAAWRSTTPADPSSLPP